MRLNSFLERAPVNILVLDSETRVVRMSRAMSKLMQVSMDEYSGRTLADLLPRAAALLQPLFDKARNGEAVETEIQVEKADDPGSIGRWSVSSFPLGKAEVGMIMREITAKRRIEDAFQQMQSELERALADIGRNNLINEMAHFLQAANTREELYKIVDRFGGRLFPENSGALCIIDSSKNVLEAVVAWGDASAFEPVFSSEDCWALREGRMHIVNDRVAGMVCAHVTAPTGAHACVPMMAQSETLGILLVYNRVAQPSREPFPPGEVRLLQRVAEQIGLSLANLRMRETLQHQALRDPLTGLYNRRFFLDALDRELRRAVRKQSSIGVIMLDVDYFKQFNDAHGHAAGDALLRGASALLQARVRAADVLCRFGGDEFSILMPEANLKDTMSRAEELRQAFKLFNFAWHGHAQQGLTISLGAAAFPTHGTTSETLLNVADAGLYKAKSAGRDQVASSSPPRTSMSGAN
jgi:diguanylate cyclase (GGDEF)-like protein